MCCKAHTSSRFFTDGFVYDHRGCAPLPVTNNHPEECIANIRLPNNSTVCNKNSTPNFIAVDRKLCNELSIRLSSLRHLNQTLYPQLILIDLTQEAHHILRGSYNKRNIGKSNQTIKAAPRLTWAWANCNVSVHEPWYRIICVMYCLFVIDWWQCNATNVCRDLFLVEFLEQYSSGNLSRDHIVSHSKTQPDGNNNLIMDVNSRQLVTYIETLHRPVFIFNV